MSPTTKTAFNHHISSQFNENLQDVNTQFMSMGGLVEQQVNNALQALLETNSVLAIKVQAEDRIVNHMETRIDEALTLILARRHPAASDLRMVIAISKANTDLERMGDEAAKIARIAQTLCEEGEAPRGYAEARQIGQQIGGIIHQALDAFARQDIEQALRVMQTDIAIDRDYQQANHALMHYMLEEPQHLARIIQVMWVLRSLERIGDHARNIAEQVIYMVKGMDVRHTSYESIERKILESRR